MDVVYPECCRKTGGRLDIRWEQQMQSIINKYPKDSRYLLPILTNDADDRQTYKKLSKRINPHLRLVDEMVQLPIPLTLYVARHSWASIAKQKQIPISVISDALGHDSEKTTLIYLSTLDTSAVEIVRFWLHWGNGNQRNYRQKVCKYTKNVSGFVLDL